MFNILQWNSNGLIHKAPEIILLIHKLSPSVICLQETRLSPLIKIPIRNYQKFRLDVTTNDNTHPQGICILTHHSLSASFCNINTTLQSIAVTIKSHFLPFPLTICNIYAPPSSSLLESDLVDLTNQLPKPYILVGDFNSHHPMWGSIQILCIMEQMCSIHL